MGVQTNAPTIIKRKKVIAGGGHHGGAWKVAYADFVTAMMAFFLLMWLLNATTEEQKKGLADYFAPTVPLSRNSGGSDGMFGGDSLSSIDSQKADGTYATFGIAGESEYPEHDTTEGTAAAQAAETEALRELERELLGRGGESLLMDETLQHVVTRLTDEGLVIEIFSRPGAPIFDPTTQEPHVVVRDLMQTVAELSGIVENPIAIEGHVPTRPIVLLDSPVWDLSTARAQTLRLLLESAGMLPQRIARQTGHADRSPVVDDPAALRNERMEIIFLREQD